MKNQDSPKIYLSVELSNHQKNFKNLFFIPTQLLVGLLLVLEKG